MEKLQYKGIDINSRTLFELLHGCIGGISFLKREEVVLNRIKEEQIYVEEGNRGELIAKIMNPFFIEEEYNEPEEKEGGVVMDLGRIFHKYICRNRHSKDLVELIDSMSENNITLAELE